MKKLILTLLIAFHCSYSFAGESLELFKKEISDYLVEQNKVPDKIIRYSDSNGNFARVVLNPDNARQLIEEVKHESDSEKTLEAVMVQYKPITQNYTDAFDRLPGQYEVEYLDHFDFIYQFLMASIKPIQKEQFDAIKDTGTRQQKQESAKLMQEMPTLFLMMLEKQIKEKKFSDGFTPLAMARLKHLQDFQSQAELKEASRK